MAPNTLPAALADFLEAHAPLLSRLHAQSQAARWDVSQETFAQALHRSASHRFGEPPPAAGTLGEYLQSLHLADLALACALRHGSEAAWEAFIAEYRPILYSAARAITGSAGEARARELADSLYAELYGLSRSGGPGKGPRENVRRPLLDYFHGRSKLSTWLRTVLAQRHVDALRAGQRTDSLDHDDAAPAASAGRAVPGKEPPDIDRARLLPRLQHAVTGALAAMPAADRLLLSLYYAQEMTLAQIARVQGVHEATISRHLEHIRREMRQNVEHALLAGRPAENGTAAQPGLSPAELDLCFTYALEDWSFDLASTLSGPAGQEKT